jgi:hypothetical protein
MRVIEIVALAAGFLLGLYTALGVTYVLYELARCYAIQRVGRRALRRHPVGHPRRNSGAR